MKKSDNWKEVVQTWARCPYCFRDVQFLDNAHHAEDDCVSCPDCGWRFQLGESE